MSRAIAVTSGQALLLPESTRKLRKERKVLVAVNSRDRDFGKSFSSNDFRFTLRRPLKDVVAIELVNGIVPADLYTITSNWNRFSFSEEGNQAWTVALTPGRYTGTELGTELQTRLNALAGRSNTYTVSYTGTTGKLAIVASAGTATFNFWFRSGTVTDDYDTYTGALTQINTPARILGFDYFDYTSSGGRIEAPNRTDADSFLNQIYLHLNADNGIELHRIERGAGRKDCFHILYVDEQAGQYYALNKDINTPIYYSTPAPISRIATLNVSLRDESFRLADLGNKDYTLLFEFTCLD